MSVEAYRAQILSYRADPVSHGEAAYQYESDGLLLVQDGKIRACGAYADLWPNLLAYRMANLPPDLTVTDYRGKLITAGFIDTHLHYPQTDIIASPAPGLLPWLDQYTFPAERRFADPQHAAGVAEFFLDELTRNGTTSALVYCTVHPQSAEALFAASHARNMRMVAGKVLMDRNCPDFLQDTAEQGILDSEALIARWHGTGRQLYAITPRFAPASTPLQLQLAGELASRYPDTFIQTHVAENHKEIDWARELFPEARSYLSVYEQFGLLRHKTVLGHGIYLDQTDLASIAERAATIAVCPTSNLFLGSGLFDFAKARQAGVQLALATDVGGGTSFSMLKTMAAAYNIACLKGEHLSALSLFYLATLGAAQSLGLAHQIGHLGVGMEADFIVLDPQATPLLARRSGGCNSLEELLFVLALLGDDRAVAATYVAGELLTSPATKQENPK